MRVVKKLPRCMKKDTFRVYVYKYGVSHGVEYYVLDPRDEPAVLVYDGKNAYVRQLQADETEAAGPEDDIDEIYKLDPVDGWEWEDIQINI